MPIPWSHSSKIVHVHGKKIRNSKLCNSLGCVPREALPWTAKGESFINILDFFLKTHLTKIFHCLHDNLIGCRRVVESRLPHGLFSRPYTKETLARAFFLSFLGGEYASESLDYVGGEHSIHFLALNTSLRTQETVLAGESSLWPTR